jgi:hypothetical protein
VLGIGGRTEQMKRLTQAFELGERDDDYRFMISAVRAADRA